MPTLLLKNQYHRDIYVSDENNLGLLRDLKKEDILHNSLKTLPKRLSLRGRSGITIFSENPVIIVRILPAYMNYPVLVHELFHCVVNIMEQAGMKFADESEEAYSYLMEDLVAQSANLF